MRRALPAAVLLLIVSCMSVHAQALVRSPAPPTAGPGRIVFVVTNETGEILPAASILVRSALDSSVITGDMMKRDGRYRIEGLPLGSYLVRVSHIGFKLLNAPVVQLTAAAPTVDIGQLKLEVNPVELAPVEAVAQRSAVTFEADRTIYHPKDLTAGAGTTIDVLRAIPELDVDMSGRVTVRGGQDVVIYLNGRPAPLSGEALASYLQGLPANRISKVEVIPNPSARYDPEGMGGIVNIELKTNLALGLSGNATAQMTTRLGRSLDGRVNYEKPGMRLFAGTSIGWSDNAYNNYDLRQNLLASPITFIEQRAIVDADTRRGLADLTGEFELPGRTTLWSSALALWNSTSLASFTEYGVLDDVQALRDRYDRDRSNDGAGHVIDLGLGLKKVIAKDTQEVRMDLRRTTSDQSITHRLTRQFLMWEGAPVAWPDELTLGDFGTETEAVSAQLDYFRPLGKRTRLDLGYRGYDRIEQQDNELNAAPGTGLRSAAQSTRAAYRYEEMFQSLYGQVGHRRGKLSAQLGLRAEIARTEFDLPVTGETFDDDYRNVFPSANLGYEFSRRRTVNVAYSRRITRPIPTYLNPSVAPLDPMNRMAGNPDIKPMYTHMLTADITKSGLRGALRVSPYYRRTANNWEAIKRVDSLGVSTVTWDNSASLASYGVALTVAVRPIGRVGGSANLGVNRDVRDASNLTSDYVRDAVRWNLNTNVNVQLTKTLTAQTNLRYTPAYDLVQGRVAGNFYSTLSVRQQVRGTRGFINLILSDPFDLYRYEFETHDRTHVQSGRTSYKIRVVSLSVTYNFGRPPQQESRRSADDTSALPTERIR